MEENNYKDEFELFLKESADDFKMVPSRKVWYSIYNNLHPDRRWPSMAVCLFILTAVLYIGIANNNSISNAARKASSENFSYNQNEKNIETNITFSASDYIKPKGKKLQQFSLTNDNKENILSGESRFFADEETALIPNSNISTVNVAEKFATTNTSTPNINTSVKYDAPKTIQQKVSILNDQLIAEHKEKSLSENIAFTTLESVNAEISPIKLYGTEAVLQKNELSIIEKSWTEDYAFRNKPAVNKLKQNGALSYYITPSSGYRSFSKTSKSVSNANTSSFVAARATNDATVLLDNAALNLEVGATLQYKVSKKVRLRGGLQGNYTNYVSNVTALGHPSQTSIALNSYNNYIRSSNYSTKAGNEKINKTTLQIALPLGADFKIAGNEKINWFVGGTLQPTYVVSGSAFVLSADEKYYISETALLRKLNLNTAIETFISFKSSNGAVLSVGPQFRYQLLSTYRKEYGYSEKIYNVGVKVGVTTPF